MTLRRGATLLETLISASVLLVMLVAVGATLSGGLRAWRRSELRAELQGNAMIALHAACSGLRGNTSRGVRAFPVHLPDGRRADALALPAAGRVSLLWTSQGVLWSGHVAELTDAGAASLAAGQPPADVRDPRPLARHLRSFSVDAGAVPYAVQVVTAADPYACTLRSAAAPLLEALNGG